MRPTIDDGAAQVMDINGRSMAARPSRRAPERPIRAGAAYFALVFACGLVLGAARMLIIAPLLGQTAAVLAEAPMMLGLSWAICGWCAARLRVSEATAPRLVMGAAAFALLMAAELGMAMVVFHRGLSEQLSGYLTAPGAIGLAAQFAFAWFPLLRARPLAAVRALHTAIYVVMAGATLFLIYAALAGVRGEALWVALGLLAVESVVFVGNGLKCPLTAVAIRHGAGVGRLFDTFLPERLTRHTFQVFAPLILFGAALLGLRWLAFGGCARWLWMC